MFRCVCMLDLNSVLVSVLFVTSNEFLVNSNSDISGCLCTPNAIARGAYHLVNN